MSIEINEGKLYADDQIVENIKEFKIGKLTLNGDHISYETLALVLGHSLETIGSTSNKELVAKGDDELFTRLLCYATVQLNLSEDKFGLMPIGKLLDLWTCHKQFT